MGLSPLSISVRLLLLSAMAAAVSSAATGAKRSLAKRNSGLFYDLALAHQGRGGKGHLLRGFAGAASSQYVDTWRIFKTDWVRIKHPDYCRVRNSTEIGPVG